MHTRRRHLPFRMEAAPVMLINIVSPCGAQWRSTLAAQLATQLSAKHPGRVLLVDGCSDEGVQWILGGERTTAYDLGDVLCGRCCIGDAVYFVGGLGVMAPAANDGDMRSRSLTALLGELDKSFDFVLFDCPCGSWSAMAEISAGCHLTVLCTHADEFHLDAAHRLRRRLPEEDSRCRLVLTGYSVKQFRSEKQWGIDRAIDRVGARLLGVLPAEATRYGSAESACAAIARRIQGENVPLMKLV